MNMYCQYLPPQSRTTNCVPAGNLMFSAFAKHNSFSRVQYIKTAAGLDTKMRRFKSSFDINPALNRIYLEFEDVSKTL